MHQHPSRRGRPRDREVGARTLDAMRALVRETGYRGVTMDAVATRANVSKAAIYRRYSSKAELAFAATIHDLDIEPPPDSGSLAADLTALAAMIHARVFDPTGRALAADLMADLERDPVLRARFLATYVAAERADFAEIIARAVGRGEIASPPSVEVLHLMLVGPLFAAAYGFHVAVHPDALAEIVGVIARGVS